MTKEQAIAIARRVAARHGAREADFVGTARFRPAPFAYTFDPHADHWVVRLYPTGAAPAGRKLVVVEVNCRTGDAAVLSFP